MAPIRLAVVGLGKIAHDQHLPAIAGNDRFVLSATVSPQRPGRTDVPHFESLAALFAGERAVDAAILCTPPQVRYELARDCLAHGLHVLLEKPPGATLGEIEALREDAHKSGLTLFAAWHSRFAAGVAPARAWLAERRIDRVSVVWREDVRAWHPNQGWIWEAGGPGVFDPGINALSILTHILPHPFHVINATLAFPSNRAAPIAAKLAFRSARCSEMMMDLDWRQTGQQIWDIAIETDDGNLTLTEGGAMLSLPTGTTGPDAREYPSLYSHFAALIRDGASDVDIAPLRLVADAYLCAHREIVGAFHD